MHIAPSYVSPELEQAAASTRTEMEVRDQIAAEATRAFWNAVRLGQPLPKTPLVPTTAQLLQHAKNHAHALWVEENLTESEFNAAMLEFCWCLADGDELRAKLLASAVIG